jgi:hypothetical protein
MPAITTLRMDSVLVVAFGNGYAQQKPNMPKKKFIYFNLFFIYLYLFFIFIFIFIRMKTCEVGAVACIWHYSPHGAKNSINNKNLFFFFFFFEHLHAIIYYINSYFQLPATKSSPLQQIGSGKKDT